MPEPNGEIRFSYDAVWGWTKAVFGDMSRSVWDLLDEDLRLAIAQRFVLDTATEPHERHASELAGRDAQGPRFENMLRLTLRNWRRTHADLASGVTFGQSRLSIGADMEALAVYSRLGVHPHIFIARYRPGYGWGIAATGRRLPVPGWPPTEWLVPHLRKAPLG